MIDPMIDPLICGAGVALFAALVLRAAEVLEPPCPASARRSAAGTDNDGARSRT